VCIIAELDNATDDGSNALAGGVMARPVSRPAALILQNAGQARVPFAIQPFGLLAQSKTQMSGTSLDKRGYNGAYHNSKSFIGHAVPHDVATISRTVPPV